MINNEATQDNEERKFKVIMYEETVEFKYTLPDEDEEKIIERDIKIVWEDTLDAFLEEHGSEKPYKVYTFRREREQKFFIDQIENETDELIDEVQEEIANKMKFGFDFSGQLHNDD
ncbi:MAG TPA: hypothetical protein EYH57_02950 [Sulfurovum sp.]|nr:hypothetical protein [Sulfurovum sp.]